MNVYQGLGALHSVQHEPLYPGAGPWDTQTYVIDALGNQRSVTYQQQGLQDATPSYVAHTGRLFKRSFPGVTPNDTMTYDAAGNEAMRRMTKFVPNANGNGTIQVADSTVEGYDVDGHLRTLSMTVRRISAAGAGTMLPVNGPHTDTTHYDALGRRVWVRTVYGDASCGSQCTELSSVTRFVWDGAQILGEIRDRGGVMATDSEMEDDAPIVFDSLPCSFSADVPCDSTPTARVRGTYSAHVGRVEYVHGGGIDQPVLVIRRDYGGDSTFFGDIDIYPHANWRGETDQVTFFNGRGDYGSNQTHPVVELPAKNELGFHQTKESAAGPLSWNGSLLAQQRDASGLMYMRNRYYDPTTGRFTQEDPIGIAGGVNLYGFAAGDALNYSDPFGLCTKPKWLCDLFTNANHGFHDFLKSRGMESGSLEGDEGYGYGLGVLTGMISIAGGAPEIGPASSASNAIRLRSALSLEEASEVFTASGGLKAEVIARSRLIVPGEKLGNAELVRELTKDGSNIRDWGKYSTETFQSPQGEFQVHYYRNSATGAVYYEMDYKVVFNRTT